MSKSRYVQVLARCCLAAIILAGSSQHVFAQSTWVAATATTGTLTQTWNTSSNWSPASVPNAVGASVSFSGTWNQGVNNIQLLGSATTTIGSITMTNIGTGTTATTGKFNLTATTGTATLKLDTGSATQPSINYTTGASSDNFLNVVLTGTQGYEKTGAGTIQVSGYNNTYTGTTKITAGGVRFIRNANLGDPSTAGPIQLNGGTLYLRSDAGSVALDDRAAFANAPGANKRNVSVTAGTSGAPTVLNVEITAGGTTVLEITGNLTSSASTGFRKSGGGTLNLKGAANYMQGVTQFDFGATNMSGVLDTTVGVSIASSNSTTATATSPIVNWTGGGTVASGNASLVVNDAGVNATPSLNVTSGTLTIGNGVSTGGFCVGGKGSGTATVGGGLLNVTANKAVSLGAFLQYGNNSGFGTLNILSGTMRASGAGEFNVGYAQTNTTASGTFAGKGVLNLSGGVLETGRSLTTGTSAQATASGTVNFNGGVLRALAANPNFMAVTTANVLNGGAVIDTNSYDVTIGQSLLNDGGAGGLTKQGGGVLTLSASNSYIGATAVSGGTLRAGNVSAFGSAAVTIASGATLDLNSLAVANAITNNGGTLSNASSYAGTQSLAGSATYGALAGTLSVVSGGAATLGGAVTGTVSLAAGGSATLAAGGSLAQSSLANNGTFTVNRSDNLSLGTVFSGSGGLTKLGSGTLTLTGSSTSSGPTAVSAGKLAVNGVLGSGTLSVAAAAWLAGTGTIGGPVVVQGTLSPGNSPGLLAVKSLDLQSTSTTLMEINSIVRGTGYDAVDVSDASGVTYGGGLELSFAALFPDNTSFDLFNFSGSPAGTFATVTASGSYGPLTFVKNAGVWTAQSGSQTISFTESSGNVLVVPEPAAASLGGVAAVSFCVWAVRRRFLADRAIA